jgi:hypothetical protein
MPDDKLSNDPWLERKYHDDPDACDLSELWWSRMLYQVVRMFSPFFWKNKLGIDVNVCLHRFA